MIWFLSQLNIPTCDLFTCTLLDGRIENEREREYSFFEGRCLLKAKIGPRNVELYKTAVVERSVGTCWVVIGVAETKVIEDRVHVPEEI